MRIAAAWACTAREPQELRAHLADSEYRMLIQLRDRERARSRAQAYVLIRSLLGCRPDEAPIFYDPDGRPRIAGVAVDISISHKNSRVAVAICETPLRVGVDLERLDEIQTPTFERWVLTSAEQSRLGHSDWPGWSRHEMLIACWSAKEAVAKATGYPLRPLDIELNWSGQRAVVSSPGAFGILLANTRLRLGVVTVLRQDRWVRCMVLAHRVSCLPHVDWTPGVQSQEQRPLSPGIRDHDIRSGAIDLVVESPAAVGRNG